MSARTVLKYVLRPADGVAEIQVPQASKVVHVGYDPNNLLALWVEQPTAEGTEVLEQIARRIHVVATGESIPTVATRYLGTAARTGQTMVWHLYEER